MNEMPVDNENVRPAEYVYIVTAIEFHLNGTTGGLCEFYFHLAYLFN